MRRFWPSSTRACPTLGRSLICRDTPILRKHADGLDPLFALGEIDALGQARQIALLGLEPGGAPIFAALMDDDVVMLRSDASDGFLDRRVLVAPGRDDLVLIDGHVRSPFRAFSRSDLLGMFGQAKALLQWHTRHGHCAKCGAPTRVAAAGWRRGMRRLQRLSISRAPTRS